MAALDFGMALARGMLPKAEKAQKDLINLAGGRNIFKSEDWWNQAVDKQISEGYREATPETRYLTESGEYKQRAGTSTTYGRMTIGGFAPVRGQFGMPYQPSYSPIFGYGGGVQARTSDILPEGVVKRDGRAVSKQFDTFADSKREDFTAGELADIETSAEAGAARAKRQTQQSKAAQKKLRKGTGGLLAKAATPEDTGLPSLGKGGLGLTTSILGSETKL